MRNETTLFSRFKVERCYFIILTASTNSGTSYAGSVGQGKNTSTKKETIGWQVTENSPYKIQT